MIVALFVKMEGIRKRIKFNKTTTSLDQLKSLIEERFGIFGGSYRLSAKDGGTGFEYELHNDDIEDLVSSQELIVKIIQSSSRRINLNNNNASSTTGSHFITHTNESQSRYQLTKRKEVQSYVTLY